MPIFPLYDRLAIDLKRCPSRDWDESLFFQHITQLSTHEYELVYALIRTHQLYVDPQPPKTNIPYHGKQLKRGLKFQWDKLPCTLQQILILFIETHLQTTQTI
jgi:hypothetical protein